MAVNTSPIYSISGDIQVGPILTTGANTYTGQGVTDFVAFTANATNGGYVQRMRFKALGTNIATVARIYVNNGSSKILGVVATPTGTPTGTPSSSGGTLATGTYFAKMQSVDIYGGLSVLSTESAAVTVTGPTGSIAWSWTAMTSGNAAASYRIFVGPSTGNQLSYFTSATNTYTQTAATGNANTLSQVSSSVSLNNTFIGELSLPVTTGIATAGTVDIDYPLNFALSAGSKLVVGLATSVSAGWQVTTIAGSY